MLISDHLISQAVRPGSDFRLGKDTPQEEQVGDLHPLLKWYRIFEMMLYKRIILSHYDD
jgi:hypothetical protein